MKPYYQSSRVTLYQADVLDALREMESESVHCAVTSPPYFALRDYGVEGQIGLEATPEAYVEKMVQVFAEVKRVLRRDSTLWLNLGDSYTGRGNYRGFNSEATLTAKQRSNGGARGVSQALGTMGRETGLEGKNLLGMPWRVAFALQADGWYLRSDIIWAKPNPMPESVVDRPTKSHEYLFLLSKSPRYFYDAEAIADDAINAGKVVTLGEKSLGRSQLAGTGIEPWGNAAKDAITVASRRNRRSVWTIPTQAYPSAHFATFPEALVLPCIKAGTSERGCCSECGRPWERVVETNAHSLPVDQRHGRIGHNGAPPQQSGWFWKAPDREEKGWRATCPHDATPVPCTVLDPFAGSGTTLAVAMKAGRASIGIELNPEYCEMIVSRFPQGVLL